MNNKTPDYILISIVALIIFCGLFALASASTVGSDTRFFNQILFGLLPGIVIAYAFYRMPITMLQKYAPHFLFLSIVLLALTLVPSISTSMRGSSRWLAIGPLTFQPSELLKLTFVLFAASWIDIKTKKVKKGHSPFKEILLPFLMVAGLIAILLKLQPDFSTLVIIITSGFMVYFAAKTPFWHSLLLVIIGIVGVAMFINAAPYRMERIKAMINPTADILDQNHHNFQTTVAVGSGGLTGKGIGMSMQKYGHVPLPASDSIFAIYAEETGFIGSVLLILLFLLLFWRMFLIAKNNQLPFARLVTIGICGWFFLQTIINIASNIGGPVTGVPLPLISHGKSHLIVEMMALGVLLNASRYIKKKK